ncbi:hypothetical protein C8Q75DRAFT_311357 [Abortiporus biennis]|nr:hypothetical protein C8Q75DRAFT_311357 [Abortiporus biennis]
MYSVHSTLVVLRFSFHHTYTHTYKLMIDDHSSHNSFYFHAEILLFTAWIVSPFIFYIFVCWIQIPGSSVK